MRILPLLTVTLSLSAHSIALTQTLPYPANATFFTGTPPSLVSADTPDSAVGWPNAHYYFTFNVPTASPEPLSKVTIAPEISGDPIAFNLPKTEAYKGTRNSKSTAITLQSVTQDPQTQAITIAFNPPVPPGTTFVVSLEAVVNNPDQSGTYLFRVQGFPPGPNPIGLDLGVGRFSFYRDFR